MPAVTATTAPVVEAAAVVEAPTPAEAVDIDDALAAAEPMVPPAPSDDAAPQLTLF